MFSYFGSKSKLVKKYAAPRYGTIIEPFAGSARYAFEYWRNQVILCDVNPKIIAVWKYLKEATEKDILSLPILGLGDHIDNYKQLSNAEKWLIGFELCRGKFEPRKVVNLYSNWPQAQKRIAKNVHKIKHWRIYHCSYLEAGVFCDFPATWFIDPPYQGVNPKHTYPYNDINYSDLADFCNSRKGQVIVCGGTHCNYLSFEKLATVWNGRDKLGAETVCYISND